MKPVKGYKNRAAHNVSDILSKRDMSAQHIDNAEWLKGTTVL